MKCEVILAREGGYEFYTNVKCRPYLPPYYCVLVTRTPRWADDFIYPGLLRVYNSFKVEEEHKRKYPQYQKYLPMQSTISRRPRKAEIYVPMRGGDGKSRSDHFYIVRIPVGKKFKEENLANFKEDDVSITVKECEFGKYIEVEKSFNMDLDGMIETVNRIARKLRLRYNLLDLVEATCMKLKIAILGEVIETKKILK